MDKERAEILFQLTPEFIIETVDGVTDPATGFIQPEELIKTEYNSGQTLILEGRRSYYENIAAFWLSCQYWYNSEGEDVFFKKLIVDDLTICSEWKENENRVGVCRPASESEKSMLDKRMSYFFNSEIDQEYLVMSPIWNENKVLFLDSVNYYLYYFWTGE